MTRRRFWLLVHRVNGLTLASFLVIVGLTGSVLAWKLPLERLFAPALFRIPAHESAAQRVDPLVVRERVAAAFPQTRVDMLDLTVVPDEPWEYQVNPRTGSPIGTPDDIFVDPYTGNITGSRHYGDIREGAKNIVPFSYELHENLAFGDAGALCLGIAALLWTFDCFIGLYLSFPASQRAVEPVWLQRAMLWPKRYWPSWCIRWVAGGFRRLYDLHRAPGVWLWPMLLLFAWTGVAFDLPVVHGRVMRVFGAAQEARPSFACALDNRRVEPDWRSGLATAREKMTRELIAHHATLNHERFLSYDPDRCTLMYRVHSSLDVDALGNTQIVWGLNNPEHFTFTSTTATRADTFTIWLEAIHEAQVGGGLMRLLVGLTGVVLAAMSVTGVLIFLRKLYRG